MSSALSVVPVPGGVLRHRARVWCRVGIGIWLTAVALIGRRVVGVSLNGALR